MEPGDADRSPITVTYDPEADAAYIRLAHDIGAGGVARTYPCDKDKVGGMILDFDHQGHLVGIEVLSGSLLRPEIIDVAARPPR